MPLPKSGSHWLRKCRNWWTSWELLYSCPGPCHQPQVRFTNKTLHNLVKLVAKTILIASLRFGRYTTASYWRIIRAKWGIWFNGQRILRVWFSGQWPSVQSWDPQKLMSIFGEINICDLIGLELIVINIVEISNFCRELADFVRSVELQRRPVTLSVTIRDLDSHNLQTDYLPELTIHTGRRDDDLSKCTEMIASNGLIRSTSCWK